jgi:hypothetical protein
LLLALAGEVYSKATSLGAYQRPLATQPIGIEYTIHIREGFHCVTVHGSLWMTLLLGKKELRREKGRIRD